MSAFARLVLNSLLLCWHNRSASSGKPLCRCSAPQHTCFCGTSTAYPSLVKSWIAALMTGWSARLETQPKKSCTLTPLGELAGKRPGCATRSGKTSATLIACFSFAGSNIFPKCSRWLRRRMGRGRERFFSCFLSLSIFNSQGLRIVARPFDDLRISCRAPSSSLPYETPDGQAFSQALHPRHWLICRCRLPVKSISRVIMAWIKEIRPRGESASFASFR